MDVLSWARSNAVALSAIAIFAAMIALSIIIYQPSLQNPEIVFKEEPLQKNTLLQLSPGETYKYSYVFNNTSIGITYAILEGPGCTRIKFLERMNDSEVCIDRNGNDQDGFNSTFRNPSFLLFKPWMLALREGWSWNSSMYISFDGSLRYISGTSYRVIRMDEFGNRTAFLVEVKSDEGPLEYEWVDAEKRVLLKSMGEGYEVSIQG